MPDETWTRVVETATEEETRALARDLARSLRGGDVVHLSGDLGAGKTQFAKGLAMGLGLCPDEVRSPTFAFVDHHPAPAAAGGARGLGFVHVDLYRIGQPGELADLGLEELPGEGSVMAVEWPERLPPGAPPRARVRLEVLHDDLRRVEITLGSRGGESLDAGCAGA